MHINRRNKFIAIIFICITMLVSCSECKAEHFNALKEAAGFSASAHHQMSTIDASDNVHIGDIQFAESLQSSVSNLKSGIYGRIKEGSCKGTFASILVILFKITVISSVILALLAELLQYQIVLQLLLLGCVQKKDGKKSNTFMIAKSYN